MRLNFNKPAGQILVDLIFRTNGIWFEYDNLEFGKPEPIPGALPWAPDTVVRVSADFLEDDRFSGCTHLKYRRINMAEVPIKAEGHGVVLPPVPYKLSDLLPQINFLYQVQLLPTDIIDETYTVPHSIITLKLAPDCLCFQGEVVVPMTLESAVANTALPGFDSFKFDLAKYATQTTMSGFVSPMSP